MIRAAWRGMAVWCAWALAGCGASPPAVTDASVQDLVTAPDDVVAAPDVAAADVVAPARDVVTPPDAPGVAFRVWAPAAQSASVVGDFGTVAMSPADGGVFTARVAAAHAGTRYHYVLRHHDATLTRIDPRARQVDGAESVVVDPTTYAWQREGFTAPSAREAVVYELHVGSFAPSPGAASGTFADVTARLDGLADLGVNAIELLPVTDFTGTGWGYGPWSFMALHPAYGAPDDLRRLVDAAHARGIAVLLDVVYNHTSGSRSVPLYCYDGDCADGSSGPYFFRDAMYRSTPWGPRPDFARAEVADALVDGIAMWLQEYRVDGFRWDSVSNIRGIDGQGTVPGGRELLVRANALTRTLRPSALRIAEDLKGYDMITRPASGGGFGFDAQWDGFVYTLGDLVANASDDARDLNGLRDILTRRSNGDAFQRVIASETHDTVGNGSARIPQRVDGRDPGSYAARKRSLLAAAMVLTAPGIPMLFMGQEHLEVGSFTPQPTPIDWGRETAHARIRACYRQMIRLRRNLDGGSGGLLGGNIAVTHYHDANKVLAFRRWDRGGDDVMVLVNLRNRAYTRYDIGFPAAGTWRVRLDTDDPQWSTDFHGAAAGTVTATARPYDGMAFAGGVPLGPWSVVVLTRDPGH